ncbi:ABC transporter substrate-binding protein [Kitasatospora sp. NPDC052896]|uniref:ABC transporter substrate-binding protein n=1 Tax=Kitasatospora sp. NPDC052896 TaxID=3364061 RepID=UPI0037CAFDE6
MARNRVLVRPVVALSAGLLSLTGCAGTTSGIAADAVSPTAAQGPVVVATTVWEAALAKAAGAKDVRYLVPATVKHAPDYDLKPTDLTAVKGADFVLYASFEPFAGRVRDAAGSKAEMIEVNLDDDRDNTTAQVTMLGKAFGTEQTAARWNTAFTAEFDELSQQLKGEWPGGRPPVVVTQTFTTWVAEMVGVQPVGTYGPDAVTPVQLAQLSAKKPQFVFDNENMSTGTVLPDSGARQLDIVNYPGADLDLLTVYRDAAAQLTKEFAGS